jgi:DNA-binding CsgD family transcriptional regulator
VGPNIRVTRVAVGEEELVVFSIPMGRDLRAARFTVAEEDITRRILSGDSNAQIAAARHTSVRTVANQIARLFRKLGVASRAELASLSAAART